MIDQVTRLKQEVEILKKELENEKASHEATRSYLRDCAQRDLEFASTDNSDDWQSSFNNYMADVSTSRNSLAENEKTQLPQPIASNNPICSNN